ncbi:CD1375 family protein [uncultured Flavonifractor sp.]|uniref:CD1375 family protein n=1 Tax=uncultured Flavonifractor sp. TaxID=1193534 RepID=UPI00344296E7
MRIALPPWSWRWPNWAPRWPPWWEVRAVANLYADLIRRGLWTLDKVPAIWQEEVAAMLNG